MKRIYSFLLFSIAFCATLLSQNTIKGVVKNSSNQEPVAGVTVTLSVDKSQTTTNQKGEFEFKTDKTGDAVLTFYGSNMINHQLIYMGENLQHILQRKNIMNSNPDIFCIWRIIHNCERKVSLWKI